MIYHSDLGAGVATRADLGRQVSRFTAMVELVQAGLYDQRRPLDTAQIGLLCRRILGGLRIRTLLLLLHLRGRGRTLIPMEHNGDPSLIVHDFPRRRLIVQLQGVDRFANYFRYS